MKAKRQYIFFWLAKLPLLLLYFFFFNVQLFYNFDTSASASPPAAASVQKSSQQKNLSAGIKKADLPAGNKISFRLNKRYQPQPAIACDPVIVKQVVCIVSSKLHVHYSSGFIPSSFPPAHALRGPPVV